MAQVKYVGPYPAVEIPVLLHLGEFQNGVPVEVPDDAPELVSMREMDCWEIDGVVGKSPEPTVDPPVPTTTPETMPTVPQEPEPAAEPAEGN